MMRSHLIITGHCATPATADPESSHQRCARNGSGSRANPRKDWHPCRCGCHFKLFAQYECGCGGTLVETDWENEDIHDVDENGDLYPVYVHIDLETGEALGEECP